MIWDQLTSPELDQLDRSIPVVLPVAATEQHGPHLPLATDRLIGEYFCQRLHEDLPDEVLILPSMGICCSSHHLDFAGTLSIQHTTFLQQAEDILGSVVQHGFRNIVILNSHGGNQAVGQVLVERFGGAHPNVQLVLATWWKVAAQALLDITETHVGGVGHAGEFETSLMLLIDSSLVRTDKIEKGSNQPTYDWAEMDMLRAPQASLYRSMQQMTSNGVFGDPTAATAEKGKAITQAVIKELQKIVVSIK